MSYKLHYAKLHLGEQDIPCIEFSTSKKRIEYISDIIHAKSEQVVFLLAFEDEIDDSIYIGDSVITFEPLWRISDSDIEPFAKNAFLQEYSSYEEAYKVALDMKEVSPLCYNK
jgi:hypothetical protein